MNCRGTTKLYNRKLRVKGSVHTHCTLRRRNLSTNLPLQKLKHEAEVAITQLDRLISLTALDLDVGCEKTQRSGMTA